MRNNGFQNVCLVKMDSDNDMESRQIYELNEIFSSTKKLRKFIQILESFFTQSIVKFSRDVCDISRLSSDQTTFFCFNIADQCICGFIDDEFTWIPMTSPQFSGSANHVTTVKKKEFYEYFQRLSHHYRTNFPDEYALRYALNSQNYSSIHLETFIASIACSKKIGPNIYGMNSNVKSSQIPVSWILEKGVCDLSVTIMNLKSSEEAIVLAEATQKLLLRTATNRLVLFDIKLQNLLDMGCEKSVEDRILAIDYDPKFTLFAPKKFTAFTFVVNTTLLLASVRCWYVNQNPFVAEFIKFHSSMLEYYIKEWDDEVLLPELYEILYKKFFSTTDSSEYIGDFVPWSSEIPKVDEIFNIATKFKSVFVDMANEYVFTDTRNIPMYNRAHFCQVLEWLGVTRTSGCNNEKLLQMATKNLPENWNAISIHSNPSTFKIMYQNPNLRVETSDRPPEFESIHSQIEWYITLMLHKHRETQNNEKEVIAMRFYDILLSDENRWYLMSPENVKVRNIFIRKLLEFQKKNSNSDIQSWCNEKLKYLLPT